MFKSGYIAILGAPNAGKSTLLNTILGEKLAAVTDKPQTTRSHFIGIHTTPSSQMIFLDTPGIHTSQKKLNLYMMEEVKRVLEDADILCFLVEYGAQPNFELADIAQSVKKRHPEKKIILLISKIDRVSSDDWQKSAQYRGFERWPVFGVSALKGIGITDFLAFLESILPEGPAFYPEDQLTDKHLRDLAAEIIREKVMMLTFEEIPYSTAVEILSFKEQPKITRIEATIVVEQESQKGMVIGKGGALIKKIGTLAREDLEHLLETHVFLELRVKVDKNWTKKPDRLAYYGYRGPSQKSP